MQYSPHKNSIVNLCTQFLSFICPHAMKQDLVCFLEVLHLDPYQPLLCHYRPHELSSAPLTEQALWPLTALITAAGVSFSKKGMLCHNPPILLLLSHFSPLSLFLLALLTFHRFYPQFSFLLADFFPLIYTTYDHFVSSFLNSSSSSSLSYLQK